MSTENPKPRRRWLLPVLILSLAANLFFVGLLGGAAFKFRGNGDRQFDRGTFSMLERTLPAERASEIANLRENFRKRSGRHGNSRSHTRDFLAALKAEPFDRARLEAAQSAIHEYRDAGRAARDAAYADFFASLTHAERVSLAEVFENRKRRLKPPR